MLNQLLPVFLYFNCSYLLQLQMLLAQVALKLSHVCCFRKVDLGQNAYLQAMYLEHQHLTLGALLNFTDGVQSSSATEHIFIFTTNFKERLDEALIRPGRMDVHLLMAFCDWEMFLTLCHNYLRISAHSMFSSIRRLLITKEVVPATVAGVLHANKDDANVAMSKVLELLQQL